jgi:hypothetical protein
LYSNCYAIFDRCPWFETFTHEEYLSSNERFGEEHVVGAVNLQLVDVTF